MKIVDDYTYVKDIDERYRNSETEEGLIIQRLISMYLKEKEKNLEISKELKDKNKQLDNIVDNSRRDELTGLYNRKAILPYFKKYLNSDNLQERNSAFSLVVIDLDHFKSVNDTYGHNVGDDVLKIVSEGLIRTFKKSDLIVRDGGDEFLVVIKNCELPILTFRTKAMCDYITDSIHKELANKVDEFGRPIERPHEYTVSLGIKEMDMFNLKDVNNNEEFKLWFKEEKDYADKEAYIQKEAHHSVRR